ncbi:MAG: tyrosine-type recombinase/integrase [Phocaeicola sp.]
MKYKYRHQEEYKGVKIDIKANSVNDLADKLKKRKHKIDHSFIDINTPLHDFGIKYLETYKLPVVSDKTYDGLLTIFNNHILEGLGNRPVGKIKPIEVQEMLNSNIYSVDYTQKIYNLTCQLFRYAYKNGLTSTDYSLDFEKPKGEPRKAGRSLTAKEELAFLKVIEGHRAEMICKLMHYCGLRTGEARSLIWKNIDLKKNVVHIYGTKTKNAVRTVPIPDILVPFLKENQSDPFAHVCDPDKQRNEKAWRNVKRLMNIEMGCRVYRNKLLPPYPVQEPLRLYDLRHTYCTNLEKQGVPISIASRLMGHANIQITAAIYTHDSDESLEMARELINGKVEEKNIAIR